MVRRYCLLAAVISALGGVYNILWGQPAWCMPLLVQLLNEAAMLLQTIFGHAVLHGVPV
jgi:hypothetical protein